MKLIAGVLFSLLSLNAFADDAPNGIICGESEFINSDGLQIDGPKPVSNGFILTGTGVLHGSNSYSAVGGPEERSRTTVRKYYQVELGNTLTVTDEPGGRVTVAVNVKKVFQKLYTSCTYLYSPDELQVPALNTGKATQAVYRF